MKKKKISRWLRWILKRFLRPIITGLTPIMRKCIRDSMYDFYRTANETLDEKDEQLVDFLESVFNDY